MKVIPFYHNEKRLIKRALKNDRAAQKAIYDKYAPKMLSVCRMYVKDLQFAEDILLRGFFKVFDNLKSFKGEGSFEGWIRKIMVRECIDFHRSKKQLYFSDDLESDYELKSIDPSIENAAVDHIQHLIDDLPAGYKMVFVLAAVEGYKHAEIAEMLDIAEGTSKSQLSKARKHLKQILKKDKSLPYGF
ncbi:MAG TPA: RNA polymerase sigma factor [Flavobacteriaceae bacterium]|nr:RNA polymerase sigma factor [Flavobacteriaceae bacterium]